MGDHGQRHFEIKTCYWNFFKTLDLFHLYCSLALLIYGPIVLYANIFIGPATLAEIPEGYKPKHWEYYKVYINMYSFLYLISQCNVCLLHLYIIYINFSIQYQDSLKNTAFRILRCYTRNICHTFTKKIGG